MNTADKIKKHQWMDHRHIYCWARMLSVNVLCIVGSENTTIDSRNELVLPQRDSFMGPFRLGCTCVRGNTHNE